MDAVGRDRPDGVAIVGMAVLLPGAPDLSTYWRNLVAGVDAIAEVPENRWDPAYYDPTAATGPGAPDRIYCRRGGFVDEHAVVEPTRFGIMPSSVSAIEPDQLIALHVAEAAIADAGGPEWLPDRDRVGVILGRGGYLTPGLVRLDQRVRTVHQMLRTLGQLAPELGAEQLGAIRDAFVAQLGPDRPESAIGLVPNLAASRIANRLDLRGPASTVDAACASSLLAVDAAVAELTRGRCDVVLAGGVHHCHDITMWSVFTQLGALSVSQRIRPFHRDADGVLMGEGTGIVVLKRLADAERDGDRVYAVIRGTGVASDGRTAALANPDPGGQTRAVRAAWAAAGLDPAAPGSVGLLEAHGTGTPVGDTAELTTLQDVFGGPEEDRERAVLGSVKSMIGHTMPAAGVASLVKAALAIHHGVLLPTLHCDQPHPALAGTRFRTISTAAPWECEGPRRAGVNAFGFGGINAHVVLEEAPGAVAPIAPSTRPTPRAAARVQEPERVLRLAASSPAELARMLTAPDAAVVAAGLPPDARNAPPCRLGIVDPTEKRLALARWAVERGQAWRGRNEVWFSPEQLLGPGRGRVAFLFPGLEDTFAPQVSDVATHFRLPSPQLFDGADVVGDVGRHMVGVMTVGRLLDSALRRVGIVPDAVAGHSVGEWSAMLAGGLYSQEDIDKFLATYDPDAVQVPGLAFAALGAGADLVLDHLAALAASPAGTRIVLSHDNAPQQTIVCGPEDEVDAFVLALRARGVLGQVLPFRSGFHTPMLEPYLDSIRRSADLFDIHPANVPVWSATTAAEFPADAAAVRTLHTRHLLEPVRFRPMLAAMYTAGFRAFVQVGVGQLTALVADTLREQDHLSTAAGSARRDGLAQLRLAATALWSAGAEVDLAALAPAVRPRAVGVRLDLGGSLLSLDPEQLPALRAGMGARPPAAGRTDLRELAEHFPAVAEFEALMGEAERSALELLMAGRDAVIRRAIPPRVTQPALPVRPEPPVPSNRALTVSLDAMPYLRDHCFFSQRPGWPDASDRFPVIPATTIIEHLADAARASNPGQVVVALHDLRFERWVPVIPESSVEIGLEPTGDGRLAATFGSCARGNLELAVAYPPQPDPWPIDAAEQSPPLTASQMYARRWMFHGPAFQAVSALSAIGPAHIRGVITAPAAPGALLDNVGQILGCWIMARGVDRTLVFPIGMRAIRFHGPAPMPGVEVSCHIRIVECSEATLAADVQLCVPGPGGRDVVWAEVSGWRDRRFDSDAASLAVERCVEHNAHGALQPGDWVLMVDHCDDLATRDIVMRRYLSAAERELAERQPPRRRRGWALGRVAVKDAVRHLLWADGEGPLWPAEIFVGNDESGKPRVSGMHGRVLPDLEVSVAHCADTAVAVARPAAGFGVGIDIEQVSERPPGTVEFALGPAEREVLAACLATGGSPELWFTRFWAAKEAVAKARGTGLQGRPREFAVVAAEERQISVAVTDEGSESPLIYRVDISCITNRPGLPPRTYVVALAADGPMLPELSPGHYRERTVPA
ncbi:MAG TPA: beta-ketoacyl synthase N-terminal-like domain-containing protein [Sporichthyaceae bacterium]|nr:beta-ketoacyl synthase N-terminal-like domain-containing protein [Sporichthyaceae bacterium]